MAINYQFKVDNDILSVEASGEDDGFQQVLDYAKAIIGEAMKWLT